jgi:hypothetical protein
VGHGCRDGAQADPLHHPELERDLQHVLRQLAPPEVGLGAGQHEEITRSVPGSLQCEVGPHQLGQLPVEDVEDGPARAIVVQGVGIERGHGLAVATDEHARRGRCARGVDPPVERRDDGGSDEPVGL